jgi:hypothetical protein
MESERWKVNQEDVSKWLKNTLIFIAPVALIYLGSVSLQLEDGLQATDFAINSAVAGAMTLYVVNVLLDFFRKLTAEK